MNPKTRRILFPLLAAAGATIVFLLVVTGGKRPTATQVEDAATESAATAPASETATDAPVSEVASQTPPASAEREPADAAPETSDSAAEAATPEATPAAASETRGLVAAPSGAPISAPTPLGSLDPEAHPYRIDFAATGAGIDRIVFSDYWRTALEKRLAAAHARAVEKGTPDAAPMPPESDRYQLTTLGKLAGGEQVFEVPLLAMRTITIDGESVGLFGDVWSEIEPGLFRSVIRDADGAAVLEVERRYSIGDGPIDGYRLKLEQRARNLSGRELSVTWQHYGPGDLDPDRDSYIEVRRFHFGYLMPPARDPSQSIVLASGQMYERKDVVDRIRENDFSLWPNLASREESLEISWFGSTNRYFSLAVYAPYAPPGSTSKNLASSVETVMTQLGFGDSGEVVFSLLQGPAKTIAPGGEASWDLGVYAGPLERDVLIDLEPYAAMNLGGLITYVMNSCCTICTFAWLANLLVVFLTFIHDYIAFDWAISIVLLVLVVRGLLHPLTRRSQIQMTRFGKKMSELKPELDALQKRFKGDPKKLQQEQLQLYREKGVNPAGCLGGMLPMFLQMPIWIALYAMLFFAFELRQQPAFFGVFQLAGGWGFLGDLSAPDGFFLFPQPIDLWLFTLKGINVLPLLMGVVFWFQQKYMAPPTTATMTEEQLQQQKIMKVMMVVMFPIMLYAAPSGLTLYILTSSCIGIIETRAIRRRIAHLDSLPQAAPDEAGGRPGGKTRDKLGRMYAEALERAKQRQAEKDRAAKQKKFKDRK
ncbi:MAG: membrane protein insertase YidC [Phycisphaerales bacterium]